MILKEHYKKNLRRDIISLNNLTSIKDIIKIESIIIQHTSEAILNNTEVLIPTLIMFELLTGQKPTKIVAKKSVAQWNVREGQLVGCKVTLRKDAMYNFLAKFIFEYLPNSSQIKPIRIHLHNTKTISFGIEDIFLFSELEDAYETLNPTFNKVGCHISITTNSNDPIQTYNILKSFNLPVIIESN